MAAASGSAGPAGGDLGGRRDHPEQPDHAAALHRGRGRPLAVGPARWAAGFGLGVDRGPAEGLRDRRGAGAAAGRARRRQRLRPRGAADPDRDAEPAAGHRAVALGDAVVRPERGEPDLRALPRRCLAAGACRPVGLRFYARDAAPGGPQLRPARAGVRAADPDPGGAALADLGPQDRLGLRLAHADRVRAGLRRHLGLGRAWLVHLPQPQRPLHRQGLRRGGRRHPDRPGRRDRPVPQHREAHRPPLGMQK